MSFNVVTPDLFFCTPDLTPIGFEFVFHAETDLVSIVFNVFYRASLFLIGVGGLNLDSDKSYLDLCADSSCLVKSEILGDLLIRDFEFF